MNDGEAEGRAMAKTEIRTDRAPKPGGSYSQGIRAGNFVFTAGQVGIDPATGELAGDTIEAQTTQVLDNLTAVLAAAGATLADVVKVTGFLTDMAQFAGYDAVYRTYFPEPRPARSSVGAKLAGDFLVEIEAVAVLPE
jgi:reactive intermediate/imine deaminase